MFLTKRRYTSTNKTCFELGNTLGPPPDPMMIEKFSLFCELGPFLDLTYWFNLQFLEEYNSYQISNITIIILVKHLLVVLNHRREKWWQTRTRKRFLCLLKIAG